MGGYPTPNRSRRRAAVNRVVVTGLGCITPIGNSIADFRTSLFNGTTGIAPFPPFPEAPGREADDKTQGLRFTQSAAVKNFDPRQHLDSGIVTATDRTTQFAIVAARQAAVESQITSHYAPEKIAIIVGCACGGRQAAETETIKLYAPDARAPALTAVPPTPPPPQPTPSSSVPASPPTPATSPSLAPTAPPTPCARPSPTPKPRRKMSATSALTAPAPRPTTPPNPPPSIRSSAPTHQTPP